MALILVWPETIRSKTSVSSIALNDAVLKLRPNAPAALFVYLCGAGRAAQALLVDPREPRCACFKCLKPEPKGLRTGWPILPDIGSGEIPAACGEDTFTPYGVAAPAIAAGLAMAICLDWVADTLSPRLRTIRVDARATVPVDDVDLERHPFCPACLPDLAV